MGVPAFFRWLSNRYPKMMIDIDEPGSRSARELVFDDGIDDRNRSRQKGITYDVCDNLYLDMNGIIHPCVHPEKGPVPTTEEEMFREIFLYVDRIVEVTNPKKLLYLAIDGVAPKAKMNQQRARRYKSTRDRELAEIRRREQREAFFNEYPEYKDKIIEYENSQKGSVQEPFDTNCISPGTDFMSNFSRAIKGYVASRLACSPIWANLKVVVSDSSVPGEGEHKIMNYVRNQRRSSTYDPNMVHVIHGLDADLIMLVLGLHEEHFYVLREEIEFRSSDEGVFCFICSSKEHGPQRCPRLFSSEAKICNAQSLSDFYKPLVLLRIAVLREYLSYELRVDIPNAEWSLTRAIDDWILLCFFVGNDFLPHMPSLEIREDAIPLVTTLWKQLVCSSGVYLTCNGEVNTEKVIKLTRMLAKVESHIFRKRRINELNRQSKRQNHSDYGSSAQVPNRWLICDSQTKGARSFPAKDAVMAGHGSNASSLSRPLEFVNSDVLMLWEDENRAERYYKCNFRVKEEEVNSLRVCVVNEYVKGLCWVLCYYFRKCASWDWYYPAHYSPLAEDFFLIEAPNIKFDESAPASPFEQLLSILPPKSADILPPQLRGLLRDENSPLKELCPDQVQIDMTGKRFSWQGIAILPFVDISTVRNALKTVYKKLSESDMGKNATTQDLLFVKGRTPLHQEMMKHGTDNPGKVIDVGFDGGDGGEVRGNIELTPRYTDAILEDVEYYKSLGLKGIRSGYFGVGVLELFEYPNDHSLQSGVFPGSVKYPSILSEYDLPGPYSDALRRLSIDISDNRVVLLPFGLAPSKFNHNLAESSIPYGAGGYRREKPQRAYPEYHGNRYNRTRYREYCQPALQGVNIPPGPRRVVDGSDNRDYHYTHYDKYGAPIPYNGPQLRSYDRPVPGPVAQMNDHPRSDGNWRVHGTKSRRYDSDSGEYDQYEYPDARSYNRQRSNDANGPMNVTNNQQNSYNYRRNQGNNGGYRRHPFYSNERW